MRQQIGLKTIQSVARDLLEGKSVAVIGGDPRPFHLHRLQNAFGLSNVVWIPTRESDASSRRFEALIRNRSADLVVSLAGLLRHQHTRDLRDLCKRHAMPLVTCWRSPNPTSVATAILQQQPTLGSRPPLHGEAA